MYATTEDSPAFWLYTSGTTGRPKGAMHRHGSIRVVCETYGTQVLGIRRDDRCLSAAKAFFAYGLGNSVLFPLSVGATAILEPSPSKPDVLAERAQKYAATLFFAGPTFFANMLRAALPADALGSVRLAASAGEPLPAALYQQVDLTLRRRHHRRHRHDRDAAHLPVQPARRGAPRHDRCRRARLRPAHPRRRRTWR